MTDRHTSTDPCACCPHGGGGEDDAKLLRALGVRPTANRLLVWRTVRDAAHPVSLSDVMDALPYADKSSLCRSLTALTDGGALHQVDDGSGMAKYEVCGRGADHHHHPHLRCTNCGVTYCLHDVDIPPVELPDGFTADHAQYTLQGRCPKCNAKPR